jgi:hypothetical protein
MPLLVEQHDHCHVLQVDALGMQRCHLQDREIFAIALLALQRFGARPVIGDLVGVDVAGGSGSCG